MGELPRLGNVHTIFRGDIGCKQERIPDAIATGKVV